jgi:hypothetical protein
LVREKSINSYFHEKLEQRKREAAEKAAQFRADEAMEGVKRELAEKIKVQTRKDEKKAAEEAEAAEAAEEAAQEAATMKTEL